MITWVDLYQFGRFAMIGEVGVFMVATITSMADSEMVDVSSLLLQWKLYEYEAQAQKWYE